MIKIIMGSGKGMRLKILTPKKEETVYPYGEEVRAYLLDEDYMKEDLVRTHKKTPVFDSAVPITLSWQCDGEAKEFLLAYGTREEAESGSLHRVTLSESIYGLTNLLKGTEYFFSVTAFYPDGTEEVASSSFFTTTLGPRVISVDGICNVRDMGGYTARSGKTTRQGRIYRSMRFDTTDKPLSDIGRKTLISELGIKTELDLRYESMVRESGQYPLGEEVTYINLPVGSYSSLEKGASSFVAALRVLTDETVFPLIFHCSGGADRGGVLAFCLGSILGYDDKTLLNDYEFTSFSAYHIRDKNIRVDAAGGFFTVMEILSRYAGETLGDRCVSLLMANGLSAEEISAIRKNMYE